MAALGELNVAAREWCFGPTARCPWSALVASRYAVRILDGARLVSVHRHCYDRQQLVRDPEHAEALAARILPNLRTAIFAQDSDKAGERRAEYLREKVEIPPSVAFQRRRPPERADWNGIADAAPTEMQA